MTERQWLKAAQCIEVSSDAKIKNPRPEHIGSVVSHWILQIADEKSYFVESYLPNASEGRPKYALMAAYDPSEESWDHAIVIDVGDGPLMVPYLERHGFIVVYDKTGD